MAKRTEAELVSDIAKPVALTLLHSKCDVLLKQLAAEYPQAEVDTWAFQLREAEAYQANNSVATPFMDAAIKDGETKATYAALIVGNNAAYSSFAGGIVKMRRNFEAAIDAATTIAELELIQQQIESV